MCFLSEGMGDYKASNPNGNSHDHGTHQPACAAPCSKFDTHGYYTGGKPVAVLGPTNAPNGREWIWWQVGETL